jgi:chemotaxis protein CheD
VTTSVQAYLMRRDQLPAAAERQTYLHPGQLYFGTEPTVVTTVLGSCVSVCLYDEEHTAAGVNHFLLPGSLARTESPRFGESANAILLLRFRELGVAVSRLRAKVFGGASMGGSNAGDLASRNIEVAVDFLRGHGIPIVSQDTGGERGRKLIFRTTDATAWVRLLGER